jgi:catechol 2,3-dioxygenase-like lactoylglutathione lyase family enzyme
MRIPGVFGVVAGVATLACANAGAQTVTAPYDHVHLAAPDPVKAADWYRKNMGGQPTSEGVDRLMFGKTRLIFMKSETALPSAGSSVDHIGFSFADLDAKMRDLERDGVKVITPVRDVAGLFKLGFVEDPWGVKIEVVQDPDTLGFHHVHLRGPDPAAILTWYHEKFGGEIAKLRGRLDAVKYGDVWVLVQGGDSTPSAGHAIDHIGWRVTDLDGKLTELKAKGVKVTGEPRSLALASGTIHFGFVEGPAVTRIEVVQR